MLGALPDAEQRVHSEFLHLLDVEHVDGDTELLQPAGAPREFFRVEHVGGLVDEIARNGHAPRDRGAGCKRLLRSRHARDRDLDLHLCGSLLLVLAFGLVALEGVAAQLRPERHVGGALRLEGAVGQIGDERDIARARGNSAHGGAAQFDEVARLEIARLADADDEEARHLKPRWRDEVERRAVLALESVGTRRSLNQVAGWSERAPRRRTEFELVFAEQDKNAFGGRAEGGKFKLQAARHKARLLSSGTQRASQKWNPVLRRRSSLCRFRNNPGPVCGEGAGTDAFSPPPLRHAAP